VSWPNPQLPGLPEEQQDHTIHMLPKRQPRWLVLLLYRKLWRDLMDPRDRQWNQ
jgi:hypothetical protein